VSIDRIPLDPQRLLLRLTVKDSDELLDRLCKALSTAEGLQAEPARLRELVDAHLIDHPTIWEDFVCLMVRVEDLAGLRISVATLMTPIPWGADQVPVQAVAIIATPHDNPAPGIRLHDQLVTLSGRESARTHIARSRSATDLARWLERHLNEDDGPLLAAEIMRPPLDWIYPETPVRDLTRMMSAFTIDAVGIVDRAHRLIGEVTADRVFTLGIPDFFRQLKSVSFIAAFDPLQRYFSQEKELKTADVMQPVKAMVLPTATLLEVIFLLSVQGHPKVYVVDDHQILLGVIDRSRVLDRLINL
jgi:CBS domain-containing protein